MATTRTHTISTRVTEEEYNAFQSRAGNRTPSEWARQVLLGELTRKPIDQALMGELWALRYILINAIPDIAADIDNPGQEVMLKTMRALVSDADQKKADKARAILAEAR